MNKTDNDPCPGGAYVLAEGERHSIIKHDEWGNHLACYTVIDAVENEKAEEHKGDPSDGGRSQFERA